MWTVSEKMWSVSNDKPSLISKMIMLFKFVGLDTKLLDPDISIDKNVEKKTI